MTRSGARSSLERGARLLSSRRRPAVLVLGAASSTAFVAYGDIEAGGTPTHTVVLGVVAAVVVWLRLQLAGRTKQVLGLISAAILTQPAVHASAKLLTWHGATDSSAVQGQEHGSGQAAAVQVLVAALIVVIFSAAEDFVDAAFGTIHRWWVALRIVEPSIDYPTASPVAPESRPVLACREQQGPIVRRGPPWGCAAVV